VHRAQIDGPDRIVTPTEPDVLVGAPNGLAEVTLRFLQTF
jgi:hypothetical protein